MGREFFYGRVSTHEQSTENQLLEANTAGYRIRNNRIICETISGSVCASQRPQFQRLMDKMEENDTLIVSRLDRLGRNAIDVQQTIADLSDRGIKVICLNLGHTDLTSPSGKLMVAMLAAVAQLERDLLIERTQSGLARAKAEGKTLGRPVGSRNHKSVQKLKESGLSQSKVASQTGLSLSTVKRLWKPVG